MDLVLVAAVLSACGRDAAPEEVPQTGPPEVQVDVVRREARWFDRDDPARVAGSQQELTASSYLLGHLERAGYLVNLDPVPVGNLLHSTNVLALPPSGRASTVVIVAYDTSTAASSNGMALGTFLELARATRAAQRDHSVEFAALGAEHVAVNGGQVGSRSLIELLKQQSPTAHIVRIGAVRSADSGISVTGSEARAVAKAAAKDHVDVTTSGALQDDVFTGAGFRESTVTGDLSVGSVLLTWLTQGRARPRAS